MTIQKARDMRHDFTPDLGRDKIRKILEKASKEITDGLYAIEQEQLQKSFNMKCELTDCCGNCGYYATRRSVSQAPYITGQKPGKLVLKESLRNHCLYWDKTTIEDGLCHAYISCADATYNKLYYKGELQVAPRIER